MKKLPVLLTFVLGITAVTGTAPAAADQDPGEATTIPLGWDAEGPESGQFSIPLFQGTSVIPGDSGQRTVALLNDGPADGVLTASIVNVEFGGNPADPFYDDLRLNGKPVSDYQHRKTAILKTTLERGESTNLDLSYHLPAASKGGNSAGAPVAVSFDVLLQIRQMPGGGGPGERPTSGGQPESGANPDSGGQPESGANPDSGGQPDRGGQPESGGTPDPGGQPESGANPDSGGHPVPGVSTGPGVSPERPVEDGTPAPERGSEPLLPLAIGAFEPIDPDSDGTPSGSDDDSTVAGAPGSGGDGGWWAAEDGPLAETGANVLGIAAAGLLLMLAGLLLLRKFRVTE